MKKRRPQPQAKPLPPYALSNLEHRAPVTRREFLGRGLFSTSATVVGAGSVAGLLGMPRKAKATNSLQNLDPDIFAAVTACNIPTQGAGMVPFIAFDLAGGGNIAGSNALVGGKGGQLDFLTTAGYNKLGIPGNMLPNSSVGAGNFVDTSLGVAMHSDSAYLRGITARTASNTRANVNGAVVAAISQTDTDLNPHNPMYGIHTAGAYGGLLVLIGTEPTVSGGNSMAPAYMIDATVQPTKVSRPSDVTGLVNTGALVGLLDQNDAVSVLEAMQRISAAKTQALVNAGTLTSAQASAVNCSYASATALVDLYGNAQTTLDPLQDSDIVGSSGIFSSTDLQDSDYLATASVMKMVINGYAAAGTIEMGGFDYHTGDRATGEQRDFKAGQCIGACLEYAARKGVPLMIYVFSDGSLASNGMIDNSVNGRGKNVWTADNAETAASLMLVFDPKGRPSTLTQQIGYFNSDGSVNNTSSPAANAVNLLAETVVLNYMALHGLEGTFSGMTWAGGVKTGLGSSFSSVQAFTQLASVSNGKIT